MLWIIICSINPVKNMTITDTFKYCAISSSSLRIDIENLCPDPQSHDTNQINKFIRKDRHNFQGGTNYTVLARKSQKISGLGVNER